MLLKFQNCSLLTQEDADTFFKQNEKEIMGIYSQYASMYPEEDEQVLVILTIMYLIIGKDEDVPDTSFEIDDETLDTLENPFFNVLAGLISITSALNHLKQLNLVDIHVGTDKVVRYSITDLGQQVTKELLRRER